MVRLETINSRIAGQTRYNVTNKSTATGADSLYTRSSVNPTQPTSVEQRTQFVPDISTGQIRDEATRFVQQSRPDLFYDKTVLFNRLLPGVLRQLGVTPSSYFNQSDSSYGAATARSRVAREMSRLVPNTYQDNMRTAESLVNKKYDELYLTYAAQKGAQVRADTLAAQTALQASKDKTAADTAAKNALKSSNARSEEEAKYAVQNSSSLNSKYSAVQSLLGIPQNVFTMIEGETPEKQNEIIRQIQNQATSMVDPYYTQKEADVKDALALTLRKINDTHKLFSDQKQYELESTIKGLDQSSAESLQTSLESLARRGVLDSGLLRRIADSVIDKRDIGVQDAQKLANFAIRQQKLTTDYQTESVNLTARTQLSDIAHEKTYAEKSRFWDLLELTNDQMLLNRERTPDITDIASVITKPATSTPVTTPARSSFTSQYSPSGSVANPRSATYQSSITPPAGALKGSARTAALMATPATTPTKGTTIPLSQITAKTAGGTLASRSALRGQARLASGKYS